MNPDYPGIAKPQETVWGDTHAGWSQKAKERKRELLVETVLKEGLQDVVSITKENKLDCKDETIPKEYIKRIEDSCKTLYDYMEFIDTINSARQDMMMYGNAFIDIGKI
jgi:hypothetical protein